MSVAGSDWLDVGRWESNTGLHREWPDYPEVVRNLQREVDVWWHECVAPGRQSDTESDDGQSSDATDLDMPELVPVGGTQH